MLKQLYIVLGTFILFSGTTNKSFHIFFYICLCVFMCVIYFHKYRMYWVHQYIHQCKFRVATIFKCMYHLLNGNICILYPVILSMLSNIYWKSTHFYFCHSSCTCSSKCIHIKGDGRYILSLYFHLFESYCGPERGRWLF